MPKKKKSLRMTCRMAFPDNFKKKSGFWEYIGGIGTLSSTIGLSLALLVTFGFLGSGESIQPESLSLIGDGGISGLFNIENLALYGLSVFLVVAGGVQLYFYFKNR